MTARMASEMENLTCSATPWARAYAHETVSKIQMPINFPSNRQKLGWLTSCIIPMAWTQRDVPNHGGPQVGATLVPTVL